MILKQYLQSDKYISHDFWVVSFLMNSESKLNVTVIILSLNNTSMCLGHEVVTLVQYLQEKSRQVYADGPNSSAGTDSLYTKKSFENQQYQHHHQKNRTASKIHFYVKLMSFANLLILLCSMKWSPTWHWSCYKRPRNSIPRHRLQRRIT